MTVTVLHGDCLDHLRQMKDEGVLLDSCCVDPPYHLTSIVDRFGKADSAPAKHGTDGAFARASRGFMGKKWDGGDIAFRPETWRAVYDVLKPGAYLLAFSATRNYHRMACAIEDAGFEIRDRFRYECSFETKYGAFMDGLSDEQKGILLEMLNDASGGSELAWEYGVGFPKSHDVSKAIDKMFGAEREVVGEGPYASRRPRADHSSQGLTFADDSYVRPAGQIITASATEAAKKWEGWGSALKPAHEPIVVARKPLEGTIAQNVLKHGVGAINIGACRVGTEGTISAANRQAAKKWAGGEMKMDKPTGSYSGRVPANVLHDGSDAVLEAFAAFGERKASPHGPGIQATGMFGVKAGHPGFSDTGTAARFFYSAKASKADRMGTTHPTTKPTELVEYLVKLITPPGGTVLDPFAGSGTTAVAAMRLGMNAVLIEKEDEYVGMIHKRINFVRQQMNDRLPLFAA